MQFATARRVFQSRTAIALRRAVLNDVDNASSVESLLTGNLAARRSRVLFSSSGQGSVRVRIRATDTSRFATSPAQKAGSR